jgi:hypothetical protein
LASFKFTNSPHGEYPPYKSIEIYPFCGNEVEKKVEKMVDKPFVKLELISLPLLSRPLIPISTAWIPMELDALLPPLPQSANPERDGMVGTQKWILFHPSISGRMGILKVAGEIGDESSQYFPRLAHLTGYWIWIPDAVICCGTRDTYPPKDDMVE